MRLAVCLALKKKKQRKEKKKAIYTYQIVLETLVALHAMAAKQNDWSLGDRLGSIKTHCALQGT
jgi:hypothetical protein